MVLTYSKLERAIENKKSGVIIAKDIIHDNKTIKSFYVFDDYNEIKKTIESDNTQHYYEIFRVGNKCNFCVDEDIMDAEGRLDPISRINNHISIIQESLIEYCKIQNKVIKLEDITVIILKSPSTEKKDSFHIIFRIDKVHFADVLVCKNFFEYMTITKKQILIGLDKSIYKKVQFLRIINSSKIEYPKNKLKLYEPKFLDNIFDTFGTCVSESKYDTILNNITITNIVKLKPEKIENINLKSIAVNDNTQRIIDLVSCLKVDRVNYHPDFFNLGLLINCLSRRDNTDYFNILLETCKQSSKYIVNESEDYIRDLWDNTWDNMDIGYSIGTLYFWAKLDNKKELDLIYNKDGRLDFALKGAHTDVAKAFQLRFGHKFIKNEDDKLWYEFDEKNGKWNVLAKSVKALHISLSILSQDFIEYGNLFEEESAKKICCEQIAAKLKNDGFSTSILNTINWMMEEKSCVFNNNPYIFTFDNGVFDLKKNVFRKGHFEEYSTISAGYSFVKTDTLLAEQFLQDIFTDKDLYIYMLKVLAGALCGEYKLEEFFIWFNRRGSNGKSTLSNILALTFGNFFHSGRQEMLLQKNNISNGENATPGLMACQNKRYIAFPEVNNQFKLDSNAIKVLTGNENISGRQLYGGETKFKIQARMSLGVNDLPELSMIDGGIVRRLRLIKFDTVFCNKPVKAYEKEIKDYDKTELRNSMINLLIKNYPEFVNNYFVPDCVKTYTDDYLKENDSIRVFCDDQIIKDESGFILKKDLKQMFVQHKDDYNFGSKKPLALCKILENHLDTNFKRSVEIKKVRYSDCLIGYVLRDLIDTIDSDY